MLFNVAYCLWPNRTLQSDCLGDFFQICNFSGHSDEIFYFKCQWHYLLIPQSSLLSANVMNFSIVYIKKETEQWLQDDLFFHHESKKLDIYKIKQSKTLQLIFSSMNASIFKETQITQNLRAVSIFDYHNSEIEVILVFIKTKEEQYKTFTYKFKSEYGAFPRLEQYYLSKKDRLILISSQMEYVVIEFSLINFKFRILKIIRISDYFSNLYPFEAYFYYLPQINRFFLHQEWVNYLLQKSNDVVEKIQIDIYRQILNLNGQLSQYILQKKCLNQFYLLEMINVNNQLVFKKHIFNNSDTITMIGKIQGSLLLIDKNTILIVLEQFQRIILHLETQTLHILKMDEQCKGNSYICNIKKVTYFIFKCIIYCALLLFGLFVLLFLYFIAEDEFKQHQIRKQLQDFKNKNIIKNNKFYPKLLLFEEEECPICFLAFETDQQVSQLLCGHTFHFGCFELWINTERYNVLCPICRQRIDDVKIKPNIKID